MDFCHYVKKKTLSISLNKRIKAHTTKSINPLRGIIIPNIYLLLENDRFSVYTEKLPCARENSPIKIGI